jgi:hypothetical protein
MNALYYLIENKSSQSIDQAFLMLEECLQQRDKIFGKNNYQNFVTCSEIIFKFHNKYIDKIK